MQKSISKIIILLVVLTLALSVNYLFAAWVGPTQAPPGGNTPAPIHVGSTNQVKDGGLSLDALSVFGGGYFQGNVGIGVVVPTEKLEVSGRIKIGDSSNSPVAGIIRWTGTDFEGYNGSTWTSLTGGEVAPVEDPDYTNCVNTGGSWIDAQGVCYFNGSSCPSGWSPKNNFTTTSGECGNHTRENKPIETCTISYTNSQCYCELEGQGVLTGQCARWGSCTETRTGSSVVTETGCEQ